MLSHSPLLSSVTGTPCAPPPLPRAPTERALHLSCVHLIREMTMKFQSKTRLISYSAAVCGILVVVTSFISCQKADQKGGISAPADSNLASASGDEQRPLPEFPCLNKNMFWRLIRTGTVECKASAAINFTDTQTKKPTMGALYNIFLDVYLSVPLKGFISMASAKIKTAVLNTQTVFVKLQLADDPDNKKPMSAVIKVKPEIDYTFKGVCSVYVNDLRVKIEEVKSPELGSLSERIPGIVNGMILLYKDIAIKAIQAKIDALEQNKFCWYYRKVFHRGEDTPSAIPEPSHDEKLEAEKILSGEIKKPEAEQSEIEPFNAKKAEEFDKKYECGWFGGC
jgi:hypothetical protein